MAASTVAREATGSSQGGLEPNRHWSGRASAAAPTMNTWSALDRSRSGSGCSCATSISAMEDIPPKAPTMSGACGWRPESSAWVRGSCSVFGANPSVRTGGAP